MEQPLMTAKELAAFLRVPVQTVYSWRYKGLGPKGVRLGRHLRFAPRDVEAWLADQQRQQSK